MFEGGAGLAKIVEYMKAHWPSKVKLEWQVELSEYGGIAKKVLQDFAQDKTKGGEMVRVAGLSGSGKTTQILPAAEAYFEKKEKKPVLVAARKFVKYHPHYEKILDFYGEENLRKMTDEFSTIMMFLVLGELIRNRFDVILDVTLLDPAMEGILVKMLKENRYENTLLMVAVSPVVTEKFLGERSWRHTKETEQEFVRATELALEFYAKNLPDMRSVFWNVYEEAPIYDGRIEGGVETFEKFAAIEDIPAHDEDALREAKIEYLIK